jgi:prepilin-type N-terminal cleavage/methylation domain-containing protein
MRLKQIGVTLFEMIIVLVVISIISSGFFMAFNAALLTHQSANNATTALMLAESRMEVLISWRKSHSYSAMASRICTGNPSPPAVCSVGIPSGFTVTEAQPDTSNSSYTILSVTASAQDGTSVTLTSKVYSY